MKNCLFVVLALIALGLILLKGFQFYSTKGILDNEAVFQTFIDIPNTEIDAYFGLENGTYNEELHSIVVKLPVEPEAFKSKYVIPALGTNSIDCNAEYNDSYHVKFVSYELKYVQPKIFLMKKNGRPLALFSESLGKNQIIASKDIPILYKKGEINNVVISRNKVSNYCH